MKRTLAGILIASGAAASAFATPAFANEWEGLSFGIGGGYGMTKNNLGIGTGPAISSFVDANLGIDGFGGTGGFFTLGAGYDHVLFGPLIVGAFIDYDFSTIYNFRTFYEFGYYYVFLADVAISCVGYLISLRLFDTHLRWAEPTVAGWVTALMCYQPFWGLFGRLYFDYTRENFAWGPWLQNNPILYYIWGSTILALYIIYLSATIVFGCRFSNLTHRGILTNGPYRWTKHPAYIAKNLAYWLTFVPFIISESLWDSIRRSAALLLVNGIYYARAKTEEAHLSQDPAYVQYKNWIARHGIFRWLKGRTR